MEVTLHIRRNVGAAAGWWRAARTWSVWSALLAVALLLATSFAARPRARLVTSPMAAATLAVTAASLNQSSGIAVVEGQVKNLSAEALENVWVRAEFLDARGQPLGRTEETLLEPARLEPGATAGFLLYGAPEREIASARLEFTRLVRQALPARHETVEAFAPPKP
jgi:hypothetical protein